jgi:hypothetical protein
MLTVPIGSRSSHRPPRDGSTLAVAVGEGGAVTDADVEDGALVDADTLVEADVPSVLGAAWVQPASSRTPARIAKAL